MTARGLVGDIAAISPGLDVLLREHLNDHQEILPHLFFGDLVRYLVSLELRIAQHGPDNADAEAELSQVLDVLEKRFGDVKAELGSIRDSFTENLPGRDEEGSKIRERLGPELQQDLSRFEREYFGHGPEPRRE